MTVNYKRTSSYRNTSVVNGELGPYVPAAQIDFRQTRKIELGQKFHRRPDLLAFELYDDAKLWWIFVLFNRNTIQDPIHDFVTGITINVPTKEYVTGL